MSLHYLNFHERCGNLYIENEKLSFPDVYGVFWMWLMWTLWMLFHNLLKFITKMSDAFSVEQFRDVFQTTPKVKNKLQPFIAQYKALNM